MSRATVAPLTRRAALRRLGLAAAAFSLGSSFAARLGAQPVPPDARRGLEAFSLPPLGYAYDALEPHLDARTMEIHHLRHHQAYVTNANRVMEDHPELLAWGGLRLLRSLDQVPESIRTTLRNNLGGHANHVLYWRILAPGGAKQPNGLLAEAIEREFGSVSELRERLTAASLGRFGSGWGWLSVRDGLLVVHSTANQDSPLMEGMRPLIGIDVWEHAYYLKYQNRRGDYIAALWQCLNWDVIGAAYERAVET